MALFVGLGPLFILCLLFDQTKGLFGRWLYYGLGTIFSLAVLSVMVTLATDMVIAVAAAFWTSSLLGAGPDGVNSMALQQGGLGLVLTMLILTAPPMAAMFFQGTMGSFVPYSQFGGVPNGRSSTPGPQGQPPGSFHQAPGSGQASALQPAPVASATTAYGPASYRLPSQASRADAIKTLTS
jgi:type IV secretion system protein VirB6